MSKEVNLKERILEVAIQIANKGGIKELTQPKVANAAGVSQSHLTYYFPRKTDLLAAVLKASYDNVSPIECDHESSQNIEEALKTLESLMLSPKRMRIFLAAVVEAEEAAVLRAVLADNTRVLAQNIATTFNRKIDDPLVQAFVDRLYGMVVRLLLDGKGKKKPKIDLAAIARECGLM